MKRVSILVLVALGLLALVAFSGCGGSGDGNGSGEQGSVSGRLLAGATDPQPLGGQTILIQTQTTPAVTVASGVTDADGYFTVTGVPAGTYNVVVLLDPDIGFNVPLGTEPPVVTVLTDQASHLDDPLIVVDESDNPPDPV